MMTLRRTTTPSAGLETCTGDRRSTAGWTTTTGFGVIIGRAGAGAAATISSGAGAAATATGAGWAAGAGDGATSTTTAAERSSNIAGSPRAMKKPPMRASCSWCVSSLIIDLWSFCINARTESSGASGSYSCFFDERIVPS